jgi:tryptophan synthase alpha subunit
MQFPLLYAANAEACHIALDPAMIAFVTASWPCAEGTMAATAIKRQIENIERIRDIGVPFVVIG